MKRKTAARDRLLEAGWILLAVIIFVLVITIRIRLLAIPLERDEGEYAYAGQLMLQGVPPYKLAYNMKFPGTYAAYALIMAIFGQTIVGVHLGLLLVNTATILLVFLLGKRLINSVAGITAASTYALLAVSPSVLGLAAHAEHFVMLPVLAGTLLLLREGGTASQPPHLDRRLPKPSLFVCNSRIFVSGLLFGIGLLMKQPAVFFILFGALYLLSNDVRCKRGWKRALVRNLTFDLGAIVPFAIACLLLWRAGVFDKFWFWTINYARQYGTLVPFQVGAKLFSETASEVFSATWALWTLAALGVIGGFWDKRMRASAVFLVGLLAFSLAAFSAGFYFREHYYVFVLPAVSLFAGIAISTLSDLGINRASPVRLAPLLLCCAALSQPILAARKFYFEVSPVKASHLLYGGNPFPESVRVAEYLRDHSEGSDTIAVLGSEPQIYFYSKRHSATGYIYTYGLMEPQSYARQMQEEMIRQIESARPKYVIWISASSSWLQQATSEGLIFDWGNAYLERFYDVVGLVNILSPDRTDYYFDELPNPMPQLSDYILIGRRKS